MSHRRVHRHAAVVAHMSVSTGSKVKQRRLAAVGVAYQRHVDGAVLAQRHVLQVVVGVRLAGYQRLASAFRRLQL